MRYCEECGLRISIEEHRDNLGLCDRCADEEEYWYEFLMGRY